MTTLEEIARSNSQWSLEELVRIANELLPRYLPENKGNTRFKEDLNPRLVRHYTSRGLIDEPLKEGKYAVYTYRHLLQLLVARRLMGEGLSANAIIDSLIGKTDVELENLLNEGVQLEITSPAPSPADSALDYLNRIRFGEGARVGITQRKAYASFPANFPENPESQWTRLEIRPGLEIHIRDNFSPPVTANERQKLERRILQALAEYFEKRKQSP